MATITTGLNNPGYTMKSISAKVDALRYAIFRSSPSESEASNVIERPKRRKRNASNTVEISAARMNGLNDYYAELRNDPEAWSKELEEWKLWDRTVRDGLNDE